MSTVQAIPIANRLLAALSRNDYVRLFANCEQVELTLAEVLNRPLSWRPANNISHGRTVHCL